ncbi:MAG: EAL domain-containing protein [Gammaproteobacteria bacterium]|nr:EAL domain-containing protein [Gammaproteobacteria bacterium]
MQKPNGIKPETHYHSNPTLENQNNIFILALRNAIKKNLLSVQYQPRYDVLDGCSYTLEALVRWPNNASSTLQPESFLNVAIKHGLIYTLDQSVFKKCCSDLIWFHKNIDKNIKIAVNISPMECESMHHIRKLINICESSGLSMNNFEFEITEHTHINDYRKIKAFCNIMIERGATISLDDFGTSFSPLSNLCELPISYIKIDKSFTDKIGYGGRSAILIKHLIKLAHEMDIKVVSEGIEHAYQRDYMIKIGCDQLQGYYMCKPLDPYSISTRQMKM